MNAFRLHKLSIKLGFSIPCNVFEYGLVIPHYGTIVVGEGNKIGAYCVLHTSTCITAGKKRIGRGLYVSTGAKIIHDIELGEGITIGANSIVNKDCVQINKMLAGVPAKIIKPIDIWFIRDGEEFTRRYRECENLKKKMKV